VSTEQWPYVKYRSNSSHRNVIEINKWVQNKAMSKIYVLTLVLCAWLARNSQIETKLNVTFFKLKKKERKILNSIFEMILYNIANIDLRWATHTFYTWLRSVLTCLSVWRSCETSYSYILHMALFCTHLFISMTFLWDELLLYST
jgi:hypothetical protein